MGNQRKLMGPWHAELRVNRHVHLRRIADFTILRSEREHGARLDALMRDAGGKRLMTEEIQIKYGFEEGELDLIAGNLFPTRHGTSAEIEGREAEVASTAQIVATKIRARGRRAPARDLFDIAVAEREDPAGCEAGVNAIPAQELLRDIEAIWRRSGEALAEEAKTMIEPSPRYDDITADPATAACATIDRLTWRSITLRYGNDGATRIGQRGATSAVLVEKITTQEGLDDAIIRHGAYGDPMSLRYEQADRWMKIVRARDGTAIPDERVKTVVLEHDHERGLTSERSAIEDASSAALRAPADQVRNAPASREETARAILTGVTRAAITQHSDGPATARCAEEAITSAQQARAVGQTREETNKQTRGF